MPPRALLAPLALAALCACRAPAAVAPPPAPPPLAVPAPPPRPKVALVLGAGAARGFAHVGVIRALEQEQIPIDLVVGTSVGSLIGAIYAADRNSFELEWTAFTLEKEALFDYGLLNAVRGMGAARGDKLEEFVRARVKQANIEELKLPFAAVATDLNWGTRIVLDRGPVARAVRASSAIPGIFQPVVIDGKLLVDGGVVDPIAIDVARAKGADVVVAVDIGEAVGNTDIKNLLDVSYQAVTIMSAVIASHARSGADVVVTPAVGNIGMLDFTQKKRCMELGIEAGRAAAPAIRKAIEAWVAARAQPRG
ncbi:MAG: patatin-like phospholipase family protein [Anaeromyxobacteraceae bacterium]